MLDTAIWAISCPENAIYSKPALGCFVDSLAELYVREDVLSMTKVITLVCLGKTYTPGTPKGIRTSDLLITYQMHITDPKKIKTLQGPATTLLPAAINESPNG